MSLKPTDSVEPKAVEECLRRWRYAVNAFHLEATDCREMFRLAAERARRERRREDAYRLIREGRERVWNALSELEASYRNLLDQLDADIAREERVLNNLLEAFRADAARWGAFDPNDVSSDSSPLSSDDSKKRSGRGLS